jgi:hypothetical protein
MISALAALHLTPEEDALYEALLKACASARTLGKGPIPEATGFDVVLDARLCECNEAIVRRPLTNDELTTMAANRLSRSIDGVGLADERLTPERREYVRRVAEKSEPNIGILLAVADRAAELLDGEGGAKRFGFQLTAAVMEFCAAEWRRLESEKIAREQN